MFTPELILESIEMISMIGVYFYPFWLGQHLNTDQSLFFRKDLLSSYFIWNIVDTPFHFPIMEYILFSSSHHLLRNQWYWCSFKQLVLLQIRIRFKKVFRNYPSLASHMNPIQLWTLYNLWISRIWILPRVPYFMLFQKRILMR